jgi:phenylpropionate dioxygenase-like ring-hydroxylating dioxygenase large terminal subunit
VPAAPAPPESPGRFATPHVLDHWYVACESAELRDQPKAFKLFGIPLVLFRNARGEATTLIDRCAHRNMPLRVGRVINGELECHYHGWRFDGGGRCTLVPALCGAQEGPARRVSTHATAEQQGLVYVYGRADTRPNVQPYVIPYVDDTSYHHVRYGYAFEATLYSTIENILDVPHTAFLHRGLFRGGRA